MKLSILAYLTLPYILQTPVFKARSMHIRALIHIS